MNISIFVKLFHKRINLIAESDMEGHRLLDNKIRENYLTTKNGVTSLVANVKGKLKNLRDTPHVAGEYMYSTITSVFVI